MRLQLKSPFSWIYWMALFLWGIRPPSASGQQSTVKYKKLQYKEKDPGIEVNQDEIEVLLEMDNEDRLNFSYLHDALSGASPTGIMSTDAVTGASTTAGRGQQFAQFEDTRNAVSLGYSLKLDRETRLNSTLAYSDEQDYTSRSLTLGAVFELNKKNTTLTPAYTRSEDEVRPVNGSLGGDKTTDSLELMATQVLNQSNLIRLGYIYTKTSGFLTDPYKSVLVGTTVVPESRPDTRASNALLLGWRTQPFEHHAFDLDLRYYQDDWELSSTALKIKYFYQPSESWVLEFFWRYYQQVAAEFWADNFPAGNSDAFRTSDQRLSRFVSVTTGLTATYKLSDAWWLEGSLARYIQSGAQINVLGLNSQNATVEAQVASLAIQYRF